MIPGTKTIVFPKQATVAYVDFLLRAVREVRDTEDDVIYLDLIQTTELSAILICFLCGLVGLARERNKTVRLRLSHNRRVREALQAVDYLAKSHAPETIMIADTMCQLRTFEDYNTIRLDDMLERLQYNHRRFNNDLRFMTRLILTELLTNTLDHSGEKRGYACMGIWGRSHNLHIAFLDFGVGIPDKLRTRYGNLGDDVSATQRLLQEGLTTRQGVEGGRGYQIIQQALRYNKGRLHLFSGCSKIGLKYDRNEYSYKKATKPFHGTCVDFQINLDGKSYYQDLGQEEAVFS